MAFNIIRTWELSPDGEEIYISDPSKLVRDPEACTVHLKADEDGLYYVGGDVYHFQTEGVKIGCIGTIVAVLLDAEYSDTPEGRKTGFRIQLLLDGNAWYYSRTTYQWEQNDNPPHTWNTVEEINSGFAGLPKQAIIDAGYRIGFRIQPYTMDPVITPHIRYIRMVYEANPEPSIMEDLLYKSLVPKLKGADAPVDAVYDVGDADVSTITFADISARCGIPADRVKYVEAVAPWDSEAGAPGIHRTDVSWDGTSITTTGAPFTAGSKWWLRVIYEPVVLIDTFGQDYVEGEQVPSIVVSNIVTDNIKTALGRDFGRGPGWASGQVQQPQFTTLDFTLTFSSARGPDLARFIERANRAINWSPYLYSYQLGERYRFRILGNIAIGGGTDPNRLHTATVACKLENVSLVGPSPWATAVQRFNISGDLSGLVTHTDTTGAIMPVITGVQTDLMPAGAPASPYSVVPGMRVLYYLKNVSWANPITRAWLVMASGLEVDVDLATLDYAYGPMDDGNGVSWQFMARMFIPAGFNEATARMHFTTVGGHSSSNVGDMVNLLVSPPTVEGVLTSLGNWLWLLGPGTRLDPYIEPSITVYGTGLESLIDIIIMRDGGAVGQLTSGGREYASTEFSTDIESALWSDFRDIEFKFRFGGWAGIPSTEVNIPIGVWTHEPNTIEVTNAPAKVSNFSGIRVHLAIYNGNGAPELVTGTTQDWAVDRDLLGDDNWEVDIESFAMTALDHAGPNMLRIEPGTWDPQDMSQAIGVAARSLRFPMLQGEGYSEPMGSRFRYRLVADSRLTTEVVAGLAISITVTVAEVAYLSVDVNPLNTPGVDDPTKNKYGLVALDALGDVVSINDTMEPTSELLAFPGNLVPPAHLINGCLRFIHGMPVGNPAYGFSPAVVYDVIKKYINGDTPDVLPPLYTDLWTWPPNP